MSKGNSDAIFSREIAAGYDPAVLAQTKGLVVGVGALGQPVAMSLAVLRIDELLICDCDRFEPTNAPRSPLFPSARERRRWGSSKARVVAEKLRRLIGRSARPRVKYVSDAIQAVGDVAFAHSSIVFSAVDNGEGRRYMSDRCRRHGKVLVEGGFTGTDVSVAVYRNHAEDPCWSCSAPPEADDGVRFSCDRFARQAEQAGVVPATQPAAATLAGLMVEAGVRALHGDDEVLNRRLYLNVRSGHAGTVQLPAVADCPGEHQPVGNATFSLRSGSQVFADELLDELREQFREPQVVLPAPFVVRAPCAGVGCGKMLAINVPSWRLRRQPRCQACGGGWTEASGEGLPLVVHAVMSSATPELHRQSCQSLGMEAGTVVQVLDQSGRGAWARLAGENDHVFRSVSTLEKENIDHASYFPAS